MRTVKLSQRFKNFINEYQWERASNYIGADHTGYLVLISSHRDASYLTQYNYQAACELFKEDDCELNLHIYNSHWACGYIEFIAVKFENYENDINIRLNLYKAMKLRESLDDYPVIDDFGYSEYYREQMHEVWESNKDYWTRELCEFLSIDKDDLSEKQLENIELITLYTFEEDAGYSGEDDAWFIADYDHLNRGIEFISDNQLMDNNDMLKALRDKLKNQAA